VALHPSCRRRLNFDEAPGVTCPGMLLFENALLAIQGVHNYGLEALHDALFPAGVDGIHDLALDAMYDAAFPVDAEAPMPER